MGGCTFQAIGYRGISQPIVVAAEICIELCILVNAVGVVDGDWDII
jgi:hypothetical protein